MSKNFIYCVTDTSGNIVLLDGRQQVYNFGPWGRRRNAQTWTFSNVPATFLFDRGFTGHEHMDRFALINMGGRVYDPVLGNFLSPDPFVQAPANPQNYNRYGYALNNPLKYTDPTGYQTARAPGAVSWLGGGGGWGESRMGFGDNVNWNCFANMDTYTNWQGRRVSYMDTPVNLDPGPDDKDVITVSGKGTGYLLAGIVSGSISISDLYDANSITIGVTYPEPWSSVVINSEHVGSEIINITIGHGVKAGGEAGGSVKILRNVGDAASVGSGVIGLIQLGMLEYRMSLPLSGKIGTFTEFSSTYTVLGRFSGSLGTAGALVGLGFNINDLSTGKIGVGRFVYRTGSIGASIGTASLIGGPWGAVAGVAVEGISAGFEGVYDNILVPRWDEINRRINNFENGIRNGWYPGR